ncbi:PREDICTED: WAT1-related protein At4g30420 [Prunus mume]|uniref:WAT1-related protein n=1 Tax=Prunus mume TaxID=102107 RepID=A0ABM0NEL9_PRUMU|nr:PREDICTED: WAT1-related protein At4g30420 [Prunus mume]
MEDYKAVVAMIGMQSIYAGLALFTRVALVQGTSPRVFVVYRQAIGSLLLAPFACFAKWRNPYRASLGLKGFCLIFLSSLIGVTANQNAYFEGLYLASSTIASAMANLVPAITFVLATVVGFEKVNLRSVRSNAKIVGTIICVGGAIYMTFIKGTKLLNTEFEPSKSLLDMAGENLKLGCLFLFLYSVFASTWVILQVPVSACCPDHLYSAFWMSFLATIQSAIVCLVLEHDLQVWHLHSALELGSLVYAGFYAAVSFFIQTWCISEKGPLYVAMFSPLCTVITTIVAGLFLHEELYLGSLVGAIAVIIGLYIVIWGKAKDPKKMKQEVDSEQPSDQPRTIEVFIDDSSEKTSCKIDLEEPLLPQKLP